MRPQRLHKLGLLFFLAIAAFSAGCKVTADDIEYWKGTQKGPGKILAVMVSDRYDMELRVKAALALVEMEPRSQTNNVEAFDGVAALMRALQERLEAQDRVTVADGIVPGVVAQMNGSNTAQAQPADSAAGPPPEQIRAKDAAFLLIPYASPAKREELVAAVIRWYTTDFNSRSLSGNFSAEQVVTQLGARAASMLVDAMNERMPERALVKLTELISRSGDDATKLRAGTRLVEIERAMQAQPFLDWIKGELRRQRADLPQAQVDQIAEATRQRILNDGVLPAMKFLAAQGPVAERLLQLAETGTESEDRRRAALAALEGAANRTHLPRLLNLALTPTNPVAVRDYAFDRIGDIRDPSSIERMWGLVGNAEGQRLRWRGGELVLLIGGPAVVPEFFNRLPAAEADGTAIKYEPEELEGYAQRLAQMTPPPTELVRQQFASPDWWDRVIAMRYFERRGVQSDVATIEALRGDTTATAGTHWGNDLNTVGKVAEAAAAALRARLANPTGAAPAAPAQ